MGVGVGMVMSMVMGKMEYEGWRGMIETFAKVCVAMQWWEEWVITTQKVLFHSL